jgi:hypothetical protein
MVVLPEPDGAEKMISLPFAMHKYRQIFKNRVLGGLLRPLRRKDMMLQILVKGLMAKGCGAFYKIQMAAMIITKMITIYCHISTK